MWADTRYNSSLHRTTYCVNQAAFEDASTESSKRMWPGFLLSACPAMAFVEPSYYRCWLCDCSISSWNLANIFGTGQDMARLIYSGALCFGPALDQDILATWEMTGRDAIEVVTSCMYPHGQLAFKFCIFLSVVMAIKR